MIIPRKKYRIKGTSEYFEKKYKTSNPLIIIEDTVEAVFGRSWLDMAGNPACMLAAFRLRREQGPAALRAQAFYGHISMPGQPSLGEVVLDIELEEVPEYYKEVQNEHLEA